MESTLTVVKSLLEQLPEFKFDSDFFVWTFDRIPTLNRERDEFLRQSKKLINASETKQLNIPHWKQNRMSFGGYQNWPVLNKTQIRSLGEDEFINHSYTGRRFAKRTSGSSGLPFTVHKSENVVLSDSLLTTWKTMLCFGVTPRKTPLSLFITDNSNSFPAILVDPSGDSPSILMRYALGKNQDEGFARLVQVINAARPQFLSSNPNLLVAFVEFCKRRGIKTKSMPIDGFMCSGGMLTSEAQKVLERAAPQGIVLNAYLTTEFGFLGAHCRANHLHLDQSQHEFEIVNEKLIITSTKNELMPLVRYEIGDRIEGSIISSCECGRPGFVVEKLSGRKLPNFKLPSGQRLSPSVYMHAFEKFPDLAEYQVDQVGPAQFLLRIECRDSHEDFPLESFLAFVRRPLGSASQLSWSWAKHLNCDKFQRFRILAE